MNIRKGKTGISLIVLVITIIVLSILAATVIISLLGSNIISEAQNTVNKYNQSLKDEQITYQDIMDMSKANDKNAYVLEGEGTESTPYLIDSIEDLVLFAYEVNNGKTYEGKYVKLNRNLDFNSNDSYENPNRTNYDVYGYEGSFKETLTTGTGFIPIGNTMNNSLKGNSFYGTFDGNGKIISNLRINKEGKVATDIGLFTSNVGKIKNLGIKDCNIVINCKEKVNNWLSVGVICGFNRGTIDGCWSSGNMAVTCDAGVKIYCGGISAGAKKEFSECSINNCYSKVDIMASIDNYSSIGGIVAAMNNVSINNCYNLGNIKGVQAGTEMQMIGGVVGGRYYNNF